MGRSRLQFQDQSTGKVILVFGGFRQETFFVRRRVVNALGLFL